MKENSITKNAFYNIIKSISAIVFPLISFPYVSRVLSAEGLGKINFGNSVLSYFTLIASLGISTYAIRECSKVRSNKNELENTASQIFSINFFTTLIAYFLLLLTLIFAKPLANYRVLIVIQSMAILFTTLGADWVNSAMGDFKYITLRSVFFQLLSIILMFIFVKKPEHYMIYAIISVVSSAGASILNIFYRKQYCKIKLTRHIELKKHLSPILLMFSLILSQTIYTNSDMTIIGLFHGDYEVGLYSAAVRIYTIVNTLVASIATVLMPKLSYAFSKNNYTDINDLLRYGLNFIVVLGLPCIVGLNAICSDVIYLLAGADYLPAAPSLRILTVALLMSFFGGFVSNLILIPSGREKICLKTSIISALTNLFLNILLIPYFGINAAAFTTAFAEFVGFAISIKYVEKDINVSKKREIFIAPIIGCFAILLVTFLVGKLISSLFVRILADIVISAILYFLILIVMRHKFILNLLKNK